MKIKLLRSYVSKNGNDVFVYTVDVTAADKEKYKAAQGENFREQEDGTPLWFTTRCVGDRGTLVITSKGNVIADMSEYKKAASLASQFGGNFGQELARATVAQLLGTAPVSEQPVDVKTEE